MLSEGGGRDCLAVLIAGNIIKREIIISKRHLRLV
jgi:hypothetical protein